MCTLAQRFSPGPMCFATPNFFATLVQPRHLDAVRIEALPEPVNQARRDHDRAHAIARRTLHHLVDLHAQCPLRRRREWRVLIEHFIDKLAARSGADDAGAVGVQKGLTGVGKRLEHSFRCGAMAGISGVDRYVRVQRGLSQNLSVVERPAHRSDAELR